MKNGLINRLIGRVGLWLLTLGNKEHDWQECGCWNCEDIATWYNQGTTHESSEDNG